MYWWRGMMDDVRAVTRNCESCAKSRATLFCYTSATAAAIAYPWSVLQMGGGSVWSFPCVQEGQYILTNIMVCIEHLSKHCEAIPLPSKTAANTASAFN